MRSNVWKHSICLTVEVDLPLPESQADHWEIMEALQEKAEAGELNFGELALEGKCDYEIQGTPQMIEASRFDE